MKKPFLLLLIVSSFALTGCGNGTKKTTYAEFHEQAVEASNQEAPKVKKVVINGTIEGDDKKYTAKNLIIEEGTDYATLSLSDYSFILVIGLTAGLAAQATETEGATYYVGNGFRIKTEEAEMAWDQYLKTTLIKGKVESSSCNIRASYTYEKQ